MSTITIDQQVHGAVLRAAFAVCHPPEDWKAPIDVLVPWETANFYMQAIEHNTGVKPDAVRIYVPNVGTFYHLTCCGYRAGPAGP